MPQYCGNSEPTQLISLGLGWLMSRCTMPLLIIHPTQMRTHLRRLPSALCCLPLRRQLLLCAAAGKEAARQSGA
jgi:hypothetical protein